MAGSSAGGAEREEQDLDAMVRAGFEARQRQIEAQLTAVGAPPAASVYEERDYFIMQLPEAELTLLYEQYNRALPKPCDSSAAAGHGGDGRHPIGRAGEHAAAASHAAGREDP